MSEPVDGSKSSQERLKKGLAKVSTPTPSSSYHPLMTPTPYREKRLIRNVGRAIHRYNMISDGDRIAVGLSGGKDSLTLMWVLMYRLRRIPITYSLLAIYIDLGFSEDYSKRLKDFCNVMGYNLHIEYTDYGNYAHSSHNRENPCFLCARLRRKRLFELADEFGCNKLALGHNKDDIIETLFLNMFYSGEISTMTPYQPFFQGKLTIIRPLALIDEQDIAAFAQYHGFPELKNPCPSAVNSKRSEIKEILAKLYQRNRKVKGNIFRAMSNVKQEYLL